MPRGDPRDVKITTHWSATEVALLRQELIASGDADVSKFIRGAALNRQRDDGLRRELRGLWDECIKLSSRVASAEPGREQKAVLVEAKIFFSVAAKIVLKLDQKP